MEPLTAREAYAALHWLNLALRQGFQPAAVDWLAEGKLHRALDSPSEPERPLGDSEARPEDVDRAEREGSSRALDSPPRESEQRWSFTDDYWGDEHGPDLSECDECGKPVMVAWGAPNDLWQRIVGEYDAGVLCPSCFDRKCAEHKLAIHWTAEVAPISGGTPTEPPDPPRYTLAEIRGRLLGIADCLAVMKRDRQPNCEEPPTLGFLQGEAHELEKELREIAALDSIESDTPEGDGV